MGLAIVYLALAERLGLSAHAVATPVHLFDAKVSAAAWKTKPSWYIVSKRDAAIAPDEERFFAKRMKATTTEVDASHVPMLSQPEAVAAVIMDAAAKALGATTVGGR